MTSRRGLPAMLVALALGGVIATGCGAGDEDSGGADPQDISAADVAVVGDRAISKRDLDRRVAALRRAQRREGGPTREQLEQQAMAVLLQSAALEEEAERLGLRVADTEVQERWAAAAAAQFSTKAKLRAFLGRQRRADILYQLRLQALTDKIQDAIRRDAGDGGGKAVQEFQRTFHDRWKEQTACRSGYVVVSCGNASSG